MDSHARRLLVEPEHDGSQVGSPLREAPHVGSVHEPEPFFRVPLAGAHLNLSAHDARGDLIGSVGVQREQLL